MIDKVNVCNKCNKPILKEDIPFSLIVSISTGLKSLCEYCSCKQIALNLDEELSYCFCKTCLYENDIMMINDNNEECPCKVESIDSECLKKSIINLLKTVDDFK